jgi:hypothetical protein
MILKNEIFHQRFTEAVFFGLAEKYIIYIRMTFLRFVLITEPVLHLAAKHNPFP